MRIISGMAKAFLAIALLTLIVPDVASAQTFKVNCDKGQSVQDAVDRLQGPGTIVVTGTCAEYLEIKKDDVTIQGGTYQPPAPPDPGKNLLWVVGARRVVITGATVTGGYNAVSAYQGASLTLENSAVSGAANNGVVSVFGSTLMVNSSTIQGNLQGATAADNSAIVVTKSVIQNNAGAGVLVIRSASARIGQNLRGEPGKCRILSNGGSGVVVSRGSHAVIDRNDILNNSGSGVAVEGSSATVIGNTISGNGGKGISVASSANSRIGITDGDQPLGNTIVNNAYDGIQISNSASAYILANTISFNGLATGRHGVGIHRASGRLMGGNVIEGNGAHGVSVNLGQLYQGVGDFFNLNPPPDQIKENAYSGISGWNGAHLDLQNLTVTNNTQYGISLGIRSTLRIYDATISGHTTNPYAGIGVWEGSAVSFNYPAGGTAASITGNYWGINCGGGEASITGNTSGVVGNIFGDVSPTCTGF